MSNVTGNDPRTISSADSRLASLLACYGDGRDGASPTADQWRMLLAGPSHSPVTLINFFRFRQHACYPAESAEAGEALTGEEAMLRYAATSGPALEGVGGRFVLMGALESTLIGNDEDWDAVAVGSYPTRDALLALFDDGAYRAAWRHRRAATARQRVLVAQA